MNKNFCARDLGFFKSDRRGPFVETKENEEVFQNVFVFTNQTRAKAEIYDLVVLHRAVPSRKRATWHTYELQAMT